ncbi:MAG: thiamine-phosphate kinase [Ktedonobacterales bacterium]
MRQTGDDSNPQRARPIGEFELIARLTAGLPARPDVALGPGDDAALLALDPDSPWLLAATVDAQVEGRHFVRGVATPEDVGHKALAVNLSDLAAIGAEPLWALVSLVLPPSYDAAEIERIYAGMRALAERYGVAIAGGNVAAAAGPLVVDVTALGRVRRGAAVTRAGGHPGDALLVTGTLGAAAAGLLALVLAPQQAELAPDVLSFVRAALVAPQPRVAEGRALAAMGGVGAMLDVSDGLAADLRHLCAASGVGALLDAAAIPIAPAARVVAEAYGRDALELALSGGEDYELLCAVRAEQVPAALDAVARAGGMARLIGELTDTSGELRMRGADGISVPLDLRGWDHLRA